MINYNKKHYFYIFTLKLFVPTNIANLEVRFKKLEIKNQLQQTFNYQFSIMIASTPKTSYYAVIFTSILLK